MQSDTQIKNEPYTIQEAIAALDTPLRTILRITSSTAEQHDAALEILVLANIISKWALVHAIASKG